MLERGTLDGPRTFEILNKSNPQTTALPSRLIKMFFWCVKGVSESPTGPAAAYIAQFTVNDVSFMEEFHT
jgi:hypothetical protein